MHLDSPLKSLLAHVSPTFSLLRVRFSLPWALALVTQKLAPVLTDSSDEEPPPPTALHGIKLLVPGGQSVSGVIRSNFHLNHARSLDSFASVTDAMSHWHRQHLSAICAGPNGCSSKSPLSQFGQQWTWKWLDVHMLLGPRGPSKSRMAPTLFASTSISSALSACWTYSNNNWSICKPWLTTSLSA